MHEQHPHPHRWLGLTMLSLGVAIVIVDATIVNVAIPQIIRDLGLSLADAEWVTTIYSLVFAALLITLGRVGDVHGRRRLFLLGLGFFVGASMLAGLAPNGGLLIGARVLQGIGAAVILPSTLSSVNAIFRGRERAMAFGIWGAVIGGMAALGPLLGGWLTTDYSWRWAFYVNVPIGLVGIIGGWRFIPETRDERDDRRLDVVGSVLVGAGMLGLVYGLIEGPRYGWWKVTASPAFGGWTWPFELSPVVAGFAVGVAGLVLFVTAERRRRRRGLPVVFDLDLFRYGGFRWGNLTSLVLALGEFGLVFVLPLFLQSVLGYTALRTGVVLSALAVGAFFGGPAAAWLAHRFGPRRVVSAGMAIEAVAILWATSTLDPHMSTTVLVAPLFVYGIGVGLATAQLTNVILAEIPPRQSGQASGMRTTFRQVGSALGIAVLGTVLAAGLRTTTQERLEALPALPPQAQVAIAEAVSRSAGQVLPELAARPEAAPVVDVVKGAITDTARTAAHIANVFVVLGLLMSLLLPDVRPGESGSEAHPTRNRATGVARIGSG